MVEFIKYTKPGLAEKIVPGDTATGITATIHSPTGTTNEFTNKTAIAALILVEDNSIRFSIDGVDPTNGNSDSTDVGFLMEAGRSYLLEGATNVINFKCIDEISGTAGTVDVQPFFS